MLLIERCLVIDVHRSFTRGSRGRLRWREHPDFSIDYRAEPDWSAVHLSWEGTGQSIRIVTLPLANGGWRRLFDLGDGGRLARKLYGAPGSRGFVRRGDLGATRYLCQVGPMPSRLARRADAIVRRYGVGVQVARPARVRGRRWERMKRRVAAARAGGWTAR